MAIHAQWTLMNDAFWSGEAGGALTEAGRADEA